MPWKRNENKDGGNEGSDGEFKVHYGRREREILERGHESKGDSI